MFAYRALTRTEAFKFPVNPTLVEHGLILFRDQQYSLANFILPLP